MALDRLFFSEKKKPHEVMYQNPKCVRKRRKKKKEEGTVPQEPRVAAAACGATHLRILVHFHVHDIARKRAIINVRPRDVSVAGRADLT